MFSCVANRLPHIGSLILRVRSKSWGKMSEEYGGCSNSSHPQCRSSCHTHSALWGLAGLLHCSKDADVYSECHVVPVAPESPCCTMRSLF
ncbi:hypothetical protein TNCT_698471 [Trichonephila clavata]|uniref:Uncharacterized protein n=1 Tax=Trichonephila clavata TaxID=2740835 RepID=A0A8X6GVN0_TRICU|nr:hypothetical protein TNCT_698471 [Trichonephila clavata]